MLTVLVYILHVCIVYCIMYSTLYIEVGHSYFIFELPWQLFIDYTSVDTLFTKKFKTFHHHTHTV